MMDKNQIKIVALLLISVIILFTPVVVFLAHRFKKTSGMIYRKTRVSYMLVFSVCLICSVWCLRYAVGYYRMLTAAEGPTLTWWEEIFNSIVHVLQTFSMDEDYMAYIIDGKMMLRYMFGENTVWQNVYGSYSLILNFIAPIAGGAVIFEILASIFPKIKLHLLHFVFWKEKYYFSELNSASLALAKSISGIKFNYLKKPIIIFTDTYIDDEEEKGSELFLEAKLLGAICVRDDLSHVKKNKLGMRKFFLIDEAESGNLQTLAELASSSNSRYLKKSEVYLFTNDDAYVQVEGRVREKLESKIKEEEMPIFVPVQSYRNLISNLLESIPLYEPLIGKEKNADGTKDLTVTILGTGNIGTEMFLSAYWFGQILDCNLKINVISQEKEEEFWNKIDYVNPEIRHTMVEGDPILQINRKGDMAKVYCNVNYLQCDVRSSKFIDCLTKPEEQILNTDYFFVSLGTDEDNISVANTIRKYVGEHHINLNSTAKTIITYVVYDSELSCILNLKKYFKHVNDTVDVYMQAVGGLSDVYSVNNVFMTKHKPFAQKVGDAYDIIQNRRERAEKHNDRMKDDYKYWANLSRGMHTKYKIYSMGMLNVSLFDYPDAEKTYSHVLENIYEEYQRMISGVFEFESLEQEKEHLALLHRLAWLEHRRWNAFTRVKGFRKTNSYNVYAKSGKMGSYKQMDIKLHPCLIECDQNGIRATISSKGVIDEDTVLKSEDHTDFDLLDELSYDLHKKGYNNYDFKQYDYPIS